MAKKLTSAEMRRLARVGAAARLAQLEREIAALKREFPGLTPHEAPAPAPTPDGPRRPDSASLPRGRSARPRISDAERKAVSERMKRYWDARRKAETK